MDDIIHSNRQGAIMVVHAHGNNMDKIREYVPILDNILGTTQSIPLENVYNFGGFTDGDRCLFLAAYLGAKNIVLAGIELGKIVTRYSRPDIEDPEARADNIKEKKLEYAKKLVEWAVINEDIRVSEHFKREKINNFENVKITELNSLVKNRISKQDKI